VQIGTTVGSGQCENPHTKTVYKGDCALRNCWGANSTGRKKWWSLQNLMSIISALYCCTFLDCVTQWLSLDSTRHPIKCKLQYLRIKLTLKQTPQKDPISKVHGERLERLIRESSFRRGEILLDTAWILFAMPV